MEFLGINQVAFARVFTKIDKLNQMVLEKSLSQYDSEMQEKWESMPSSFISSSVNGIGREEILNFIEESINIFSNGS
jgi:GTP-binding protein